MINKLQNQPIFVFILIYGKNTHKYSNSTNYTTLSWIFSKTCTFALDCDMIRINHNHWYHASPQFKLTGREGYKLTPHKR